MGEEEIITLQEDMDHANKLREESENIEHNVAIKVGNGVQEWLDLGKKTEALQLIGKVFNKPDERNQFWFQEFKKMIYRHM